MTPKEWEKPVFTSFWQWIQLFFAGLCVGGADIVPGISGGTVAFIIGIYEDLLKSIATFNANALKLLLKGKFREFSAVVAWQFLLTVLLGVATAFLTLAKVFVFLLNHEVYRMWLYATFMGLVAGSVFYCCRQIQKWSVRHYVSLLLAGVMAYFLTGADLIPKGKAEELYTIPYAIELTHDVTNYNREGKMLLHVPASMLPAMIAKKSIAKETLVTRQSDGVLIPAGEALLSHSTQLIDPWIMLCGAMAISAMLLPGISGSYLLTVLGMYGFILGSLLDFLHGIAHGALDMAAFRVVLSMGLGISIGALLFSRVVLFLLRVYREVTLACLIGFMIGALRAVWPFWLYSYELSPLHLQEGAKLVALEPVWPSVTAETVGVPLLMVCGFGLVLLVERMAARRSVAM